MTEHDHVEYAVGDRISYKNKTGTVSRTKILGMKPCCAVQVDWDDNSIKTILQTNELKEVVKL